MRFFEGREAKNKKQNVCELRVRRTPRPTDVQRMDRIYRLLAYEEEDRVKWEKQDPWAGNSRVVRGARICLIQ